MKKMTHTVTLETVSPRVLAAVRRHIRVAEIPATYGAALDQVWAFVRSQPGLRTDGHNVFLYHHASGTPASGMDIDFGVEVTRRFPPERDISCVETPACRAAVTVHHGPYSGLGVAHAALDRWCRDNGHKIGLWSWEIYGDWSDDESKLETTIAYALA